MGPLRGQLMALAVGNPPCDEAAHKSEVSFKGCFRRRWVFTSLRVLEKWVSLGSLPGRGMGRGSRGLHRGRGLVGLRAAV